MSIDASSLMPAADHPAMVEAVPLPAAVAIDQ
jgi:hypothetical protein